MSMLRRVMIIQAVILALYGIPYLLAPTTMQALTGQPPVPEPHVLRALGIAFLVLAWLESQITADLPQSRQLTLAYAVLSAVFFVTIAVQLITTGFNGARWGWWELREIVRRWQAGEGVRAIARGTGMDRKTITEYLRAAQAVGVPPNRPPPTDELLTAITTARRPGRPSNAEAPSPEFDAL